MPDSGPKRVYIEPSSRCNLNCRTCIRRTWEEPQGDMEMALFRKAAEDLRLFPSLESAMLGGFGEPTLHPGLVEMVRTLKGFGLRVELTTNATLLNEKLAAGLVKAGLDRLWASFDGAEDPGFEHVREGASFQAVVENLKRLRGSGKTALGLAFVVTRSNLKDLQKIGGLARRLGADRVSVSNVIPYSPEMEREMLCDQALNLGTHSAKPAELVIDLPRLDLNDATRDTIWGLMAGGEALSIMGHRLGAPVDECRFIRERCLFIRWDGKVAPCMGLLHSHEIHFHGYRRKVQAHAFGDAAERNLKELWESEAYAAFRAKVAAFDFSPCHACGGCSYTDDNKADCTGNVYPATCGGCLWAQGIVQCP
ncbi:MAG TPA: radical SAM protein [Elusimicrobia bacterium]|nr:radical SAM protein [Elusimicrobiota bacterium]